MAVKCYFCGKCFGVPSRLRYYLVIHTLELPLRCKKGCNNERFANPRALLNHNKKHHPKTKNLTDYHNNRLSCYFCAEKLSYSKLYHRHLQVHTGEKPLKCAFPNCRKWVSTGALSKHKLHCEFNPSYSKNMAEKKTKAIQAVLSKVNSCYFCGSAFAYRTRLYQHMKTHLREDRRPCPGCKETFDRKYIAKHMKVCEKLKEKFRCKFCSVPASSASLMNRHIRLVHTKEIVKTKCYFCNKMFHRKSSLLLHYRLHTYEKPWNCQYCRRDFTRLSFLKIHILNTHPETRDGRMFSNVYRRSCYFCGKFYFSTQLYFDHIRCHTKELIRKKYNRLN